jgi:excisionase family DNA binding protein
MPPDSPAFPPIAAERRGPPERERLWAAMTENERLLTVRETAARLGQGESTIRRKIRSGELLAVKFGHGARAPVRVPADYLDAWLYAEPIEERSGS